MHQQRRCRRGLVAAADDDVGAAGGELFGDCRPMPLVLPVISAVWPTTS
jgi:hypothetical protein